MITNAGWDATYLRVTTSVHSHPFKELLEKTSNLETKSSDGKILKISELRGLNLKVTCDYYMEKSNTIALRR